MKVSKVLKLAISEKDVQKQILDYLKIRGVFCWRNQTTGIYDPTARRFRKNSGMNGVADVLGVLPQDFCNHFEAGHSYVKVGRFLAIEVKAAKGKQSLEQFAFQKAVEENGGLYILARSVDDVKSFLG